MEDVQIIIDGEVRQLLAELDAFTLYTMAQNPPVLVRLADGHPVFIARGHYPMVLTPGMVFESRLGIDGV